MLSGWPEGNHAWLSWVLAVTHTCSNLSILGFVLSVTPLLSLEPVCCSGFKWLQVRERNNPLYLSDLVKTHFYCNPDKILITFCIVEVLALFLLFFFSFCDWLDLDFYCSKTTGNLLEKKMLIVCCCWIWMCWYTWHGFGRGFTDDTVN